MDEKNQKFLLEYGPMLESSSRPIRILIVDDHKLMRQGLRMLIGNRSDMAVAGEAGSRKEALDAAGNEQPDVILLDLDLGGANSLEFLVELRRAAQKAKILILTGVRDADLHKRAMMLGAVGLVMKDHAAETLLEAIEHVHSGESWVDHMMTASLIHQPTIVRRPGSKEAVLTDREAEIASLACQGLKNSQIAARLSLSPATVRNHITAILRKLGLSDRFELALYCYRNGLASPPQPGT